MAVTKDKPAPYAPSSAILALIERYRSRGLPTPVDSDVLARAGVSQSLVPRTLQALQALGLLDDEGKPTETFDALRLAPESEFQQRLSEWLDSVYAEIILFVDPADDETKIRDAFRSYQPIGQQPRMVSLFLGLYAAAGKVPERPTRKPRPAVRAQQKGVPARAAKPTSGTARGKTAPSDPIDVSGLPAPIAGLLSDLPKYRDGWTAAERERFVATFGAILDYCIPIIEARAKEAADEETTAADEDDSAAAA